MHLTSSLKPLIKYIVFSFNKYFPGFPELNVIRIPSHKSVEIRIILNNRRAGSSYLIAKIEAIEPDLGSIVLLDLRIRVK